MTGPTGANTGFGRSLVVDSSHAYVGLPGYSAPPSPPTGQVRIYVLATEGPTAPFVHTLVNPAPTEIQRLEITS